MHRDNTTPSGSNRAMIFAVLACLAAVTPVQAQYRGPPAGYGPPGGVSGPGGSGRPGGVLGGLDFDVDKATHYRTVHGILAATAFVILFPVGAMAMRLVPGRTALWLHAVTQLVAYVFFIAAVGLGLWLVEEVRIPAAGGSLLNISTISYHPIIGLLVFAALLFQPVLGFVHHARFKKLGRRQIWSHLHLWNGRVAIPLGIINGGLGLHIAGAPREAKTAYAAVAGVLGGLWLVAAVFSEVRRRRRGSPRASRDGTWGNKQQAASADVAGRQRAWSGSQSS